MKIKFLKKTFVFLTCAALLQGCIIKETIKPPIVEPVVYSHKGICVYTECNAADVGLMIFGKNGYSEIKFYEGGFDDKGEFSGSGVFYFNNGATLSSVSTNGVINSGTYFFSVKGEEFAITFNEEKIDPEKIRFYSFQNKVKYQNIGGGFSYEGRVRSLKPDGKGIMFKDSFVFDGVFEKDLFYGTVSNNSQDKIMEIEENNKYKFTYKFGESQKTIYLGSFHGEKFVGEEKKYIKDKEVLSYYGSWFVGSQPTRYENFKFFDFIKNGIYNSNPNSVNKSVGNFVKGKREGYFDVYQGDKIIGFNYFKNNKKLYYVPLYLEIAGQIKKNNCEYIFPDVLNLWVPYSYNSCIGEISNITFIDKENKNYLLTMIYNKKINKIEEITVYEKDMKYVFKDVNFIDVLGAKEYTLSGSADIYKWVKNHYILSSNSEVDLRGLKELKTDASNI